MPVVIELKAVKEDITPSNLWQVSAYMKRKDYQYGVVVNFNQSPKKKMSWQFLLRNKLFDPETNQQSDFDSNEYVQTVE